MFIETIRGGEMKEYILKIELQSPTLPGGGEGWAEQVDTDVVYDELGLPYIPAKRIKGILREAANDIVAHSKFINLPGGNPQASEKFINELLGQVGAEKPANLCVGNAYLPDYRQCREWLQWANSKSSFLSPDKIINSFTSIRQQTAIEKGVAKQDSLRVLRLLNSGLCFQSDLSLTEYTDENEKLLVYTSLVMRNMGINRNRGMGKIKCSIFAKGSNEDLSGKYRAELKKIGVEHE